MRREFDRIQNSLSMKVMKMKHYELPPSSAGRLTDMSAWNNYLENSMSQFKHQAIRYTILLFFGLYSTKYNDQ